VTLALDSPPAAPPRFELGAVKELARLVMALHRSKASREPAVPPFLMPRNAGPASPGPGERGQTSARLQIHVDHGRCFFVFTPAMF